MGSAFSGLKKQTNNNNSKKKIKQKKEAHYKELCSFSISHQYSKDTNELTVLSSVFPLEHSILIFPLMPTFELGPSFLKSHSSLDPFLPVLSV